MLHPPVCVPTPANAIGAAPAQRKEEQSTADAAVCAQLQAQAQSIIDKLPADMRSAFEDDVEDGQHVVAGDAHAEHLEIDPLAGMPIVHHDSE